MRPAQRVANGYRRFEADLERLRFVGRAKHLGWPHPARNEVHAGMPNSVLRSGWTACKAVG